MGEVWLYRVLIGIIGFLQVVCTGILLDYLLNFRPGLAEKFALKKDLFDQMEHKDQQIARVELDVQQFQKENREDHGKIFDEIKNVNKDMNQQFINVNKQFADLILELKNLNGGKGEAHDG